MKKLKRLLLMFVTVLLLSINVFCAFGCQTTSTPGINRHIHQYTEETKRPTATQQGETVYTCACGEKYVEYTGYTGKKQVDMNGYSILFIGNSYTFWHDLPQLFKNVAKSAGIEVNVDSVTRGGYSLNQFSNENDQSVGSETEIKDMGNGSLVAQKLKENKYDIVFLQDFSTQAINNLQYFYIGVYRMNEKVKENGATSILYQTWARKEGSSTLSNGLTVESMTMRIAANYNVMGEALGVPVSPVGIAFYNCVNEYSEIELYDDDKTHPSLAGHYLAALCHFATVYGLSPIGIEYKPDGLPSSVAEKLQNVAYNAVFKKTVIEEEYLVTKDMVEKELNDSGVFDTVIKFDN